MDYFLTEEQQMIVDTARQITREKIIPQRAELDEKNEFPPAILRDMAKADLFGVFVPEEYGGFGGGCFEIVLALEELARGCVGVATSFCRQRPGYLSDHDRRQPRSRSRNTCPISPPAEDGRPLA